jgi:hypothetical protein
MKTKWQLLTNNQRNEILALLTGAGDELYHAAEAAREVLESAAPSVSEEVQAEVAA